MNAALVIMAAGLGSRYGGVKQIERLGPDGEILMEYAIYDALRAGFARAKNTAQTRGAIRTRVVIELESYQQREVIDGYSDVRAEADESDGSICAVSFCFGVAHGLSRVELKANITI